MNNVNNILNKPFKNYIKLKRYYEITKDMINDFNQIKKEYNKATEEYILKISHISSNYEKIISNYKVAIELSNNEFQDLIQLLEKFKSILTTQAIKLQAFIEVSKEEDKNKIIEEIRLNNYEKLTNEFLLKEKTITKMNSESEENYINLFNSYNSIENSMAQAILSKENRSSAIDILNQGNKIIHEKENIVKKSIEDLSKFKNEFFSVYDEILKETKELTLKNIDKLKININCFLSLYMNYCKTFSEYLYNIQKSLGTIQAKTNFSEIFDSIVSNFERDIEISKYKIKLIDNKYYEDIKNKVDYELLTKKGYIIKENKIYLKDEDIYEIVKLMYGQFQLIDENYYNLAEEKIKIKVKELTNKLLYGNKKNNDDSIKVTPINEDELKLLFKYLEKSFNRLLFLKVLNLFRAKGGYEIPEKEFDILIKIFLLIADKITNENDTLCPRLLLILSQTFYCKKDDKKVYLQNYLKNHEMFLKTDIWERYLKELIEEELSRNENIIKKETLKINKGNIHFENIIKAQLIPFSSNMYDFGMTIENIYKIIEPIIEKYKCKDEVKNIIDDLIKSKQI